MFVIMFLIDLKVGTGTLNKKIKHLNQFRSAMTLKYNICDFKNLQL